MNKKLSFLGLIFLALVILSSCSAENLEVTDSIAAPENIHPPLEGRWVIESYKIVDSSNMTEEAANTYLRRDVIIHQKLAAVGSNYSLEPSYKVKYVNSLDYLIYNYKINPKFLDIEKEEILVISASGGEQFFYEFIELGNERYAVNIDGVFFIIRKLSDEVSDEIIAEYYFQDKEQTSVGIVGGDVNSVENTGVLIGLKTPKEDGQYPSWDYRTIFLRFKNRKLLGAYESDNLFLPRKNGFWNIEVVREDLGQTVYDVIANERIQKKPSMSRTKKDGPNDGLKNILYINSNYISLETITDLDGPVKSLEFYPLDNVNIGNPMKISDILGDKGRTSFLEGINNDKALRDAKEKLNIGDFDIDEHNFGLFRRNGYWTLKGRVNIVDANRGISENRDFYIKALMPDDIVSYDDMSIPWAAIKKKIPEADDAFISPNDDIIIIKNFSNLLVYSVEDGDIADIPLVKIALNPNDSVVMKEWAIGKYPTAWEEEFLKNNFRLLEYR